MGDHAASLSHPGATINVIKPGDRISFLSSLNDDDESPNEVI